jgi:hypothetical protein
MVAADGACGVQVPARQWWGRHRLRYNIGLVIASSLACACYLIVGWWGDSIFGTPVPTAITTARLLQELLPEAIVCLILVVMANICYYAGPLFEIIVRPRNVDRFRRIIFRLGFGLSVLLPFAVPGLLASFYLLSMLLGYGRPVRESELPGTYVADYGLARDAFTIEADGRFTQTVIVKATGKVAVASGTWRFDPQSKEITFSEDFLGAVTGTDGTAELVPDFDHPKDKAETTLEVRWLVGKLEIGGDDLPWGRRGADIPHTKQQTGWRW